MAQFYTFVVPTQPQNSGTVTVVGNFDLTYGVQLLQSPPGRAKFGMIRLESLGNGLERLHIEIKTPATNHRFLLRLANARNGDVVSFNQAGLQINGPDFTDNENFG